MKYDPVDFELPTIIRNEILNLKLLHGLVQEGTGRLMALSRYIQTISTMSQLGGYCIQKINAYNYGKIYLTTEDGSLKGNVWDWRYNPNIQMFEYDPDTENTENNYCIRLVAEKAALIDIVNNFIRDLRRSKKTDLFLQREIQVIKEQQAREYIKNEFSIANKNCYVKQYAEIYDITVEESANRIIIQADNLQRSLFESEKLRIRYYKAIKECKSIVEVLALRNDFFNERYDPVIIRNID